MEQNRLKFEKSPYLLRHADNPVDWNPWDEKAFDLALVQDKPIFLSIGYSSCHWCHVMEQECFRDEEVAALLNAQFVCIKVDREERPDIDAVYMRVCQMMTGSGGWPMTVLMTPDQKPFFIGTYFSKYSQKGNPGLMDLLDVVAKKWSTRRDELLDSAEQVSDALAAIAEQAPAPHPMAEAYARQAVHWLKQTFDAENGGFDTAPKFPTPHHLLFLLRYGALQNDPASIEIVEKTLQQMYCGGIYDHIGGGFCRYSTDEEWLVPHFEKMLYDNALLSLVYLEAYQLTGKPLYEYVARQTLRYITREMMHPDGGFFSAQDADSAGREGAYYLFDADEIKEVLGEEAGARFCEFFGITPFGNFDGANIPNRLHAADPHTLPDDEMLQSIEAVYDYRKQRTALHKDDKILTAWNGLMIVAFARAYRVFGEIRYLDAAMHALDFVEAALTDFDGGLVVRWREGESAGQGYLDDYAFIIWAHLEMYEATYDLHYIQKAQMLLTKMEQSFRDPDGGYFLTASDSEPLLTRPKEVYDNALPCGNSAALYVLLKLSSITSNPRYERLAKEQMAFLAGYMKEQPAAHTFALAAATQRFYPTVHITATSTSYFALDDFRRFIGSRFLPNVTVLGRLQELENQMQEILPFAQPYRNISEVATYYVCRDHVCYPGVIGISALEQTLNGKPPENFEQSI